MFAAPLAAALARRGIHYGWIMVALTFLVALSTAAAMGMPGVLRAPLRAEFGWETRDIAAPMGVRLALYGLVAPFAAALIQRYGMVRIVAIALSTVVVCVLSSTQMTTLWQLWATWGIPLGLATGMTALVLGATVSSRWFTARRGLVVGLLTAANATGQLIFLPLAGWLSEHVGWRAAVLPPIALCAVSLLLVVLFAVDYPATLGLAPYGETTIVKPPRFVAGNAVRNSFRALADASGSWVFWVLFFSFFVCGLSTNGLVQMHFIPLCLDMGLAQTAAASVLALIGAFDFVGTILSGWLSDRYDNRWLLFWYYGLRGVSLLLLPYADFTFLGLSMFAVFYGLDWVATVPPTVRLTAQSFGRERAPLIFGWVFTAHQLGAAVAAYGGGLSRDTLASYLPAFIVAGAACIIAAASLLTVKRRAAAAAAH